MQFNQSGYAAIPIPDTGPLTAKLLSVMRLTAFILLTACLQVSASSSGQTVSIHAKNTPVREVLREIQKQTRFNIIVEEAAINKYSVANVQVKNLPLEEALRLCFRDLPFSWSIRDKTIVIQEQVKARNENDTVPPVRAVAYAVISGTVANEANAPMAGVSIYNSTKEKGAVTTNNGAFRIPGEIGDMIVISFVGYKAEKVKVTSLSRTLYINLSLLDKSMEGFVVTGYQNIRKSDMVGSVSSIKRKDLFFDGTNTLEQMIQGRLPGTLVMNTTGMVGTRQKVRVRGTSTLLGNQEPVWVVDGIIQEDPIPFKAQELDQFGNITQDNFDMIRTFIGNSIAWLNPNDIEDITVLKDASATVLYGVKAANGVIVITTKKGEKGRTSVNYSGNLAISNRLAYDRMNLMNSKERIDVSREIYDKRLYGPRYSEKVGYENVLRQYLDKKISYAEFDAAVKRLEAVNTDWFDILFREAVSQNHSINASGGTENLRYYASFSLNRKTGTAKGNNSESGSTSINIDAQLHKKVALSVRLNGNLSKTSGFYKVDPYTYATNTSRAIPAYDDNGNLQFYDDENGYGYNVLNELANTGNTNDTRSFNLNTNLKYDILPGLRFETLLGVATTNAVGQSYATERSNWVSYKFRGYEYGEYKPGDPEYKASRLPHGGELNTSESRNTSITWRNSFAYNQVYGKKHRINFLLGQESRSTKLDGESGVVYGYFPDRGKNVTYPPATITQTNGLVINNSLYEGGIKSQIIDRKSNFLSFYASSTYSYNERYVVVGSIRADASNRFGQDTRNRFLPVWSAGVRWNVHNEAWMKNQSTISELNLRATYGWQGNVAENFGPDLIAQIPSNPVNQYTGEFALQIRSLPYGDLRWEKTGTVNLGLDLGILKNRFVLSFEYYSKKSKDVIIYKEVPGEYGVPTMPVNAGDMTNKGIELQLSGTIVRSRNWLWTMSVNSARNLNRVNSDFASAMWWQGAVNGSLVQKGYPVSTFWAFRYKGPNPQTGVPEFYIPTAAENPKAIKDVTQYMKRAGNLEPDFSGGISTLIRYKTFSLASSFNVNIGSNKFLYKIFNGNMASNIPSAYDNLPKEFVNRWRKPGDEQHTSIPSIPTLYASGTQQVIYYPSGFTGYIWDMYNYSDDRVVNASFLRCNNISLSYNFTDRVLKATRMKNLAVTASVSNPFIIVSKDFKGMDPEVATGNQPLVSVWSMGLNVSF